MESIIEMIGVQKIAFFIPALNIGGVEQCLISIANELACRGIRVQFVLSRKEGVLLNGVSESVEIIDLGNRRFSTSFFALKRYIENEKPTHLITGSNMHNEFVVLVNSVSRFKTKVILTQHNYLNIEVKQIPIYGLFHRFLMKWLYPKASKVITVSYGIMSFMNEFMPDLQVDHIYNPFDFEFIEEASKELGKDMPISIKDGRYIIFVGRFVEVKNIFLLLKAFELLSKSNKNLSLLLVGEGVLLKKLVAKISTLKSKGRIHIIAPQSNPYPLIKNAELLVLPSFSESLGGVLVEALALGTTCACTPTEGAKEVLKNGELGYISESFDDVDEFASLMQVAMQKPLNADMMYHRVVVFDKKTVVDKYLDVLD